METCHWPIFQRLPKIRLALPFKLAHIVFPLIKLGQRTATCGSTDVPGRPERMPRVLIAIQTDVHGPPRKSSH